MPASTGQGSLWQKLARWLDVLFLIVLGSTTVLFEFSRLPSPTLKLSRLLLLLYLATIFVFTRLPLLFLTSLREIVTAQHGRQRVWQNRQTVFVKTPLFLLAGLFVFYTVQPRRFQTSWGEEATPSATLMTEATPSAELIPPTNLPETPEPPTEEASASANLVVEDKTTDLEDGNHPEGSPTAENKSLETGKKLAIQKNNFRGREKITAFVGSQPPGSLKITLTNLGGQEVEAPYQIEGEVLTISPPPNFRPGQYHLKVTNQKEEAVLEQDFTWGVLAINTNKSIYTPGEKIYLQMASLDETGHTICDADLKLEISDPNLETTILTTAAGTMKSSENCGPDNVTDNPDYYAFYKVEHLGTYQLKLTNLENGFNIEDSLEVKESVPFEVERVGATRINPYRANYTMTIKVRSNQDFSGTVTEPLPDSFEVNLQSPNSSLKTTAQNLRMVEWPVNWVAGRDYELKYEYDAPNISPQFYLLGPLILFTSEVSHAHDYTSEVFREIRQWQIAADASPQEYTTGSGQFQAEVTGNHTITLIGGGGGGGGASGNTNKKGGGGGGGGAACVAVVSLTQGQPYNYSVGDGGGGGAITPTAGSPGGGTTFIVGGTTYTAGGGDGGATNAVYTGGAGGTATNCDTNNTGGSGGDGSASSGSGGGGGGAGTLGIGKAGTIPTGGGTTDYYGGPGGNGTNANGNFNGTTPVSGYGGGGGGGSRSGTGGQGYSGYIRIEWELPTITVSGTVRDTGESTALAAAFGTTVTIVSEGQSATTTTVLSDGTYTKSGVTVGAAGNAIVVYLDDNGSYKGSVVTIANDTTSAIANLDIYQDRVIADSRKTATSITNSDFGDVDQVDSDDLYSVSSSVLTVNVGYEFHIMSGKTFAPGNNANFGGSYHNTGTASWSSYSATFNSSSTGQQIDSGGSSFNDVVFNHATGGWTAVTNTFTVGGTLTITAGNFDTGAVTNAVTGATDVTGTLTISSLTGTKTFTGNVTINAGGTWSETAAEDVSFGGNLVNNATTWTALGGIHNFTGSSKTISGSTATVMPVVSIANGASVTNSGVLTVSTTLTTTSGTSSFINGDGATGTLNFGGASIGVTTFTATAVANTVNYNGDGQTCRATQYYHLQLTGSGTVTCTPTSPNLGNVTVGGTASWTHTSALTINGTLTISGGTLTTGAVAFAVTGTTTISSGELSLTNNTGNKTLTGLVTLNGGTLSGASTAIILGAGIANAAGTVSITGTVAMNTASGVLTATSAIAIANINVGALSQAFSGAGGITVSGTLTVDSGVGTAVTNTNTANIAAITMTSGTILNNGILILTGNLTGVGGLTQGASAALTLGGTSTITTLTATAGTNTVTYNGASQAVKATDYVNLTLSGSGTPTIDGPTVVSGTMTITGITATNNSTLTVTTALNGTGLNNSATGTLNIGGTSGITTLTANAVGNTVNYTGAAQTVHVNAYHHLGLGGSLAKTMTSVVTIAGDLTISGSATMTDNAAFTLSGTLNYDSSGETTLTALTDISIGKFDQTAGTLIDNGVTITVTGDGASTWNKSGGAFTATGTVIFAGGDNSNQQISGNTTFNNFTASTLTNSTGRTLQFAGSSGTTVTGIWTITGYDLKVIILQSSTTDNWTITPTSSAVTYVDVYRSTWSGTPTCATFSTKDGNTLNWTVSGGASCNQNPSFDDPPALAQKKTTDVVLLVGDWTNEVGLEVKFTANAEDLDASDTLYLCVEKKAVADAFTEPEDACSSPGVAYSGSPVEVTVTIGSHSGDTEYHWRARIKDAAGAYSSWLAYGANPAGDGTTDGSPANRDYGVDTSDPTLGDIFDGTEAEVDTDFSTTSLSQLSANWANFDATVSGLSKYQYSIGTTQGGTDVKTWTDNSTTTSVTASSLTLQTSQVYYFNVRAVDNAGNTQDPVISSDGQVITPSLSFAVSPATLPFANLNEVNSYTDTEDATLTTSTNAYNGYVIRAFITDYPRSVEDYTIIDFDGGDYDNPDGWQSSDRGFGYTSSDTLVQGVNKFGSSPCAGGNSPPCYARFNHTGPGDIIADHTATVTGDPITGEEFTITCKVMADNTKEAANYVTTIVYTITAQY